MNKEQMFEKIKIKIEEMETYTADGGSMVESYDIDSITFRCKLNTQEHKPMVTLSFAE